MKWSSTVLCCTAALCVGLTGCSGGGSASASSASGPGQMSHSASSAPSSAGGDSVKSVVKSIMSGTVGGDPIATAKGTLGDDNKDVPMIAQVLAIRSTSNGTVLIWRLKTASGESVTTQTSRLSHPPLYDTRLVSLFDGANKKSYYPYTYVPEGQSLGLDNGCLCSSVPYSTDGKGTVMHAVLPPLPTGTESVGVKIPGFATMKSVKVSS